MKPLQGNRAVITGASSGIGFEFARQLAALGCDLVIAARRIDRLKKLGDELKKIYSIQVQCIELDLTSTGAAKSLFEQATANNAIVTLLINNAGVGRYGAFTDFSIDDHLWTIKLNSTVPTELTYYFLNHMLQHGKRSYMGQIASVAAFQPTSNFTVYSGSKCYLRFFSETLAFELKRTNVSVTCICPGGTYTEFFETSGQKITQSGHLAMMSSEAVVKGSLKALLSSKLTYVPGILNKIACFFPRLLPRSLSLFFALKAMNQAVEKTSPKTELPVKS